MQDVSISELRRLQGELTESLLLVRLSSMCFTVSPGSHASASPVSSFSSRVPSGTVHPLYLIDRSPVATCRRVTVGRTLTSSYVVVNF